MFTYYNTDILYSFVNCEVSSVEIGMHTMISIIVSVTISTISDPWPAIRNECPCLVVLIDDSFYSILIIKVCVCVLLLVFCKSLLSHREFGSLPLREFKPAATRSLYPALLIPNLWLFIVIQLESPSR